MWIFYFGKTIQMKYQALFSLKNTNKFKKKVKMSSAAGVICTELGLR